MIFISSLVLSEFINRNLQLEFKHWKNITGNVNADFKRDFRQTVEYSNAKKTTIDTVKEILEVYDPLFVFFSSSLCLLIYFVCSLTSTQKQEIGYTSAIKYT